MSQLRATIPIVCSTDHINIDAVGGCEGIAAALEFMNDEQRSKWMRLDLTNRKEVIREVAQYYIQFPYLKDSPFLKGGETWQPVEYLCKYISERAAKRAGAGPRKRTQSAAMDRSTAKTAKGKFGELGVRDLPPKKRPLWQVDCP